MSQPIIEERKLLTFEFVSLCVIVFLLSGYLSVFYNLFNYLQTLDIPADLRGLVVGSFSVSAMALYLVASPFLNLANAPRTIVPGHRNVGGQRPGVLFCPVLLGAADVTLG